MNGPKKPTVKWMTLKALCYMNGPKKPSIKWMALPKLFFISNFKFCPSQSSRKEVRRRLNIMPETETRMYFW